MNCLIVRFRYWWEGHLMEDSLYLFHGNQSLVTKWKQIDFHGFMEHNGAFIISNAWASKTGPCKFSHFVIGNEAPYLTELPLFSGKFPSKLKLIWILCLVPRDLCVPIGTIHLLQVLHCQADITKPHQAPRHHITKPQTLLVSLGTLVFEMNIICQSTSITLVCL